MTPDEFLELLKGMNPNEFSCIEAKFVLLLSKEKNRYIPTFEIQENFMVGVGLIEFQLVFISDVRQKFWVKFSHFKGLDITPEDEFDYLKKYGIDFIQEIELLLGLKVFLIQDLLDLLVDLEIGFQWTLMA